MADRVNITNDGMGFSTMSYKCAYCGVDFKLNETHDCMQGIVSRVAKLEEHIARDNEERAKFNEWWDKRHSPKAIVDEWKRNVEEVAEWKRKASE